MNLKHLQTLQFYFKHCSFRRSLKTVHFFAVFFSLHFVKEFYFRNIEPSLLAFVIQRENKNEHFQFTSIELETLSSR